MTAATEFHQAPHPDSSEAKAILEASTLRHAEAVYAEWAPLSEPAAWDQASKLDAASGDWFRQAATDRVPMAREVLKKSTDPLARRGAVVLVTMAWTRQWQDAYRRQVQEHLNRAAAELRLALAAAEEFARNIAADEALAGQALDIAKPVAEDLDRLRSLIEGGVRWSVRAEPKITADTKVPVKRGLFGRLTT
jgi:hypothetical protein